MHIKNLIPKYVDVLEGRLPQNGYMDQFPSLFEHYFSFWSDKALPFVTDMSVIQNGEHLVLEHLSVFEREFQNAGISIEEVNIVLFVGQNVSNGHAAYLNGQWWVWIPVETYGSIEQVRAFVPHEIIHGLHYAQQQNLYFTDTKTKRETSRQIITEGLATLGAMQVSQIGQKEALWADFLTDEEYDEWLQQYTNRKDELLEFVLTNWEEDAGEIFQANEKGDVLRFRGGYLLALEAAQSALQTAPIRELLEMRGDGITDLFFEHLKKK